VSQDPKWDPVVGRISPKVPVNVSGVGVRVTMLKTGSVQQETRPAGSVEGRTLSVAVSYEDEK